MFKVQWPALQLVRDSSDCTAFEFNSSRRKNLRGQIVRIATICSSGCKFFHSQNFDCCLWVVDRLIFVNIFPATSFQSLSYQKAGTPSCKSRTTQKLPQTNHWRSDSCATLRRLQSRRVQCHLYFPSLENKDPTDLFKNWRINIICILLPRGIKLRLV